MEKNTKTKAEPVNVLRDEKVHVRFLKRFRGFVTDEHSPLYGGMADTAVNEYTVPLLRNGKLANPLTDQEKDALEKIMGLEEDALSIYKRPCYWMTSTKGATNIVRLTKDGIVLNLQDPEDYIKYKILLLNKETICPSWREWETNPKPTYRYVLVNEDAEKVSAGKKVTLKRECNRVFDEIADSASLLRTILEQADGKRLSSRTALEALQTRVLDLIDNKTTQAHDLLTDPLLKQKSLIKDLVEKGIIVQRNSAYYIKEGNRPLCEDVDGVVPYLGVAAAYLGDIKNQELYMQLQKQNK